MTNLHKQYTMEDVERLQWVVQAAHVYVVKVDGLSYEAAQDFAESIFDIYSDWTPTDAVEEDLSYWV